MIKQVHKESWKNQMLARFSGTDEKGYVHVKTRDAVLREVDIIIRNNKETCYIIKNYT